MIFYYCLYDYIRVEALQICSLHFSQEHSAQWSSSIQLPDSWSLVAGHWVAATEAEIVPPTMDL